MTKYVYFFLIIFIVLLNACNNTNKQEDVDVYQSEITREIREREIIDSVKQAFVEQGKSTIPLKQYNGKHSYLVTFNYPEEWSYFDYRLSASTNILLFLIPDYYNRHKIAFQLIQNESDDSPVTELKEITDEKYTDSKLMLNEKFISKHDMYIWHYDYMFTAQGKDRNKYKDAVLVTYWIKRNTEDSIAIKIGTAVDIQDKYVFKKLNKDLLDVIMSMKIRTR
jgi:hypothetical protein